MTAPLPVTLITGHLGAGKTTALNHLLTQAHGRAICVLVNDFGEIALDEALIVNRRGDTVALANGCLCCTIGNDFYAAIDRILRLSPRPEHLVIETSGVADPRKVAQVALAEPELALQGVVTVADAANLAAVLQDRHMGGTARAQLAAAGLAILTKADAAGPQALAQARAALAEHAPRALRLEASFGRVPAELLLGPRPFGDLTPDHDHHHDHGQTYRAWAWSGPGPIAPAGLQALLDQGVPGLYRMKGIVRLASGGWAAFHRAGAQSAVEPLPTDAPPPALGRAVAIGPAAAFDPGALDRRWRALLG